MYRAFQVYPVNFVSRRHLVSAKPLFTPHPVYGTGNAVLFWNAKLYIRWNYSDPVGGLATQSKEAGGAAVHLEIGTGPNGKLLIFPLPKSESAAQTHIGIPF